MAEPRIQYAKTSDGVSVAYWTLGEGELKGVGGAGAAVGGALTIKSMSAARRRAAAPIDDPGRDASR